MKKSLYSLFFTVAIAATVAGAQASTTMVQQNITRFVGDTTLAPLPTQLVDHAVVNLGNQQISLSSLSPFSASGDHTFTLPPNFNFPASNAGALLGDLQAALANLDFNSDHVLADLKTLLSHFDIDPSLIASIQTWVQNHHFEGGNFDILPVDPAEDDSDQGSGSVGGDDVAVAVPEPSSVVLMLGAAALLGGVFLRRRPRI